MKKEIKQAHCFYMITKNHKDKPTKFLLTIEKMTPRLSFFKPYINIKCEVSYKGTVINSDNVETIKITKGESEVLQEANTTAKMFFIKLYLNSLLEDRVEGTSELFFLTEDSIKDDPVTLFKYQPENFPIVTNSNNKQEFIVNFLEKLFKQEETVITKNPFFKKIKSLLDMRNALVGLLNSVKDINKDINVDNNPKSDIGTPIKSDIGTPIKSDIESQYQTPKLEKSGAEYDKLCAQYGKENIDALIDKMGKNV